MEALEKGLIEDVRRERKSLFEWVCSYIFGKKKRKSFFRWGHKTYSSCIATCRSFTQPQFNSCVKVFEKFLPADLK